MATKCRRPPLKQLFTAISVLLILVANCLAQSSEPFGNAQRAYALSPTATLAGTVTDEHDGVVPGASILVRDVRGGLKRQAETGRDGDFIVSLLPPGSYTVEVQHQGFIPAEISDIVLSRNDHRVFKIQLRVGIIGETATVEADVAPRTSPGITTAFGRAAVEKLPLNGRSLQPLISLAPGTVLTKATFTEQGQFSVNGQRANANYFMVDGVSANIGVAAGAGLGQSGAGSLPGLSVFGGTNNLISLDALQELKIQTSVYAPEFGRTPGAQVSLTTRSGTNQFRGTLFEYFRNGAWGANDWFANRDRLKKPSLRQHDFGGIMGGPLIKDRAFFFLSYEGLRLRTWQVTTGEVPSVAARQAAPVSIRQFLNAFPLPNGDRTINGMATFTAGYAEPASLNATSLRIDHKSGEHLTLFARYNIAPSETVQRGVSSSLNTLLLTSFSTQTFTAGGTLAVSPAIHNDFRANYSRTGGQKTFLLDDLGGAISPHDSALFPPSVSRRDSVYGLNLGNSASFFVGRDIDNLQRQINLVDNLSVLAGTHQLKFGFDYRKLFPIYGQRRYNQIATFSGVEGALTGIASSVSIVTQDQASLAFTNFSAYAQDTWRYTRHLTLTYGLRWELNPAPFGKGGQDLFTAQGLDNPALLTLAPRGTPHYRTEYHNFAPRAGIAYQLSESKGRETVLRGGFGIFYDLGAGTVANAASYFPYLRRKSLFNVPYPLDAASAGARPFSLNSPVSTIRVFEPDFKLPMTMQWNVGIEQSFGPGQSVIATYVGAAGRRLFRSEVLAQPNSDFLQVFNATDNATSDYHAMQLQLQRRVSRGLQAFASYTWSHSIDTNSNDSFNNIASERLAPRSDRGPSDFDVRHSLAAAVTYNLPAIRAGVIGTRLLRNWSLDTIITARTATPIDVLSGRDLGFGFFNFRPDLITSTDLYTRDQLAPGGRVINRAAFFVPVVPRQGTLGRNSLRGFPVSQVDLALHRRLTLSERFHLQFRAEVFNLLNHPNFGDPVGDLNSPLFGRSPSMLGRSLGSGGITGGLNPLYQIGGPRSLQLVLKFQF